MTPDQVFTAVNLLALPGWLVLILAPRWEPGRWLVPIVICLLLGGAYIALFASQLSGMEGGFGSLEQVMLLFQNEWLVVVGWIHYLAFDLFVGSWELRDAQSRDIAHGWVVPALFLTFMAGPAGLVIYLVIRTIKGTPLTEVGSA